ncbi:Hypothetical_protein [Hexamita inflata]|uniref:Hypothetical_protein n=1 Tax=Hexamita inflata TaxID=28002 RepID=A0AA86NPY0_9EUKA|nr:Hypothetical protein HINF_LOCUS11293 [Hexamita inflata]
MNACTRKQMRPRRVLKMKSSEKTSEFRFQEFCKAIQYLFIHLSELIRVSQLVPIDFEKFSFLSRNSAVKADENSVIIFQFLEVDLEQKEPAAPLMQVRTERETAACFSFIANIFDISENQFQYKSNNRQIPVRSRLGTRFANIIIHRTVLTRSFSIHSINNYPFHFYLRPIQFINYRFNPQLNRELNQKCSFNPKTNILKLFKTNNE